MKSIEYLIRYYGLLNITAIFLAIYFISKDTMMGIFTIIWFLIFISHWRWGK